MIAAGPIRRAEILSLPKRTAAHDCNPGRDKISASPKNVTRKELRRTKWKNAKQSLRSSFLEELVPGADFEKAALPWWDSRVLDSLTVVALVSELEDAFDITIPAVEVVVENFNSVDGLTAMVQRLMED